MNTLRYGWSLRQPLCPRDSLELAQLLENHPCYACDGPAGTLDLGEILNRGLLIYREVLKLCPCGFKNRVFVVLNDVRRATTPMVVSSEDALARALKKQCLPDPAWDEGLTALMLAFHMGDQEGAIGLAEALVALDSSNPNGWYNLSLSYAANGRWLEAFATIEHTISLDNTYDEAFYQKGRLLSRLGDLKSSQAAYREFAKRLPHLEVADDLFFTLAEAKSPAGPIQVLSDPDLIHLQIEGREHGALYKKPKASFFANGVPGPGPYAPLFQVNGLLLGPLEAPEGRAIMLGLGLGASAVSLLHQFPELSLVVVEPDLEVTRLAMEAVPLLKFHQTQGRLCLIEKLPYPIMDINGYPYDVALLNFGQSIENLTSDMVHKFKVLAPTLLMSWVGSFSPESLVQLKQLFRENGRPLTFMASSVGPKTTAPQSTHWLASTRTYEETEIRGLLPQTPTGEPGSVLRGHLLLLAQHAAFAAEQEQE